METRTREGCIAFAITAETSTHGRKFTHHSGGLFERESSPRMVGGFTPSCTSCTTFQLYAKDGELGWYEERALMRLTRKQRRGAICTAGHEGHDDFIASRVTALAEHFGARVASFEVEREGVSQDTRREARAFVGRVLHQRLHRRGR